MLAHITQILAYSCKWMHIVEHYTSIDMYLFYPSLGQSAAPALD